MDIIAKNIKYLIEKSKIPKDTLGEEFGLTRGVIGTYIAGKSKPKLDTLLKISEYFSISTDDLLKKDLTLQEEVPSASSRLTQKKENEIMEVQFLENQLEKLIEANHKAMDSIQKQMEMNMKLVEVLQAKTVQGDSAKSTDERPSWADSIVKSLEGLSSRMDDIEEFQKKEAFEEDQDQKQAM